MNVPAPRRLIAGGLLAGTLIVSAPIVVSGHIGSAPARAHALPPPLPDLVNLPGDSPAPTPPPARPPPRAPGGSRPPCPAGSATLSAEADAPHRSAAAPHHAGVR